MGTQTLTDLVFHEICHVLGFGTLWDAVEFSYVTGVGSSDPRFTGPQAVGEWHVLGGTGTVPVENEGGAGTADAHWRELEFGREVMTGFISPVGTPNPFSRVTLAAMADLGFTVDYGATDAYQWPGPALLRAAPMEGLGWDVVVREPILMLLPDGSARTIPR